MEIGISLQRKSTAVAGKTEAFPGLSAKRSQPLEVSIN
jgi:hypothetical protein